MNKSAPQPPAKHWRRKPSSGGAAAVGPRRHKMQTRNALEAAMFGMLCELLYWLLTDPSIINQKNGPFGRTLLHWASRFGHVECAKALIEEGADPLITDSNGHNPLNLAEKGGDDPGGDEGRKELIPFLLNATREAALVEAKVRKCKGGGAVRCITPGCKHNVPHCLLLRSIEYCRKCSM
jgi:hypothetical protein